MYESYSRQVPWYTELWRWWTDLFNGSNFEIAFGVIIGLVAVVIVLAIAAGIFYATDRWFTPRQTGRGRITKRWIREGHWTDEAYTEWEWGCNWSNKGKFEYHPVTKYRKVWVHPQPMVEVTLIDGDITHEFAVSQTAYDVAGMQRPVDITFQRGRFTGTPYIESYVSA